MCVFSAMGSLRKANGPLKVPRLRMKDELLKVRTEPQTYWKRGAGALRAVA